MSTKLSPWADRLDQLGLRPVRVDLSGEELEDALRAALPGLCGEPLASALIEVEQLLLGLTPQANVEWSMSDNDTVRHFRARMARGGCDDGDSLFGFSQNVTREVTERRQARQRNAELEALIEAMPEAVLLLEEGRVVLANLAARTLLDDRAAPGSPFLGLVGSGHRSQFARHARVGAIAPPATFPLDTPGGRTVEVFSADLPSRSATRVVTLRDATDRQESELRAAASDRLASVGRLAAGVAHEINNPLTYVFMNLEMLSEDIEALRPGPDEVPFDTIKQKIDDALTGTRRVADIVHQLRLFAHQRHDTEAVGKLSDAASVATQLAAFALPPSVRIQVDLPPDLPPVKMAVGPLSQVIMNLCVNAGDAIEEAGNVDGLVHISARQHGPGVRLLVHDNGPGVPARLHQAIFQPFFTTKDPGKGTGMGLSIIRRLVHEAGGTVSLTPVPSGACVAVYLPTAQGAEAEAEADAPTVEISAPGRRTLLVIEDEPALQRALAARLGRSFDVTRAGDGAEARALLEGGLVPDAILCDVEMPRVDGPTFVDWLQRSAPTLLSRVVVMTGGTLDPVRAAWLEELGRPVVAKPLHMPSLQRVLAQVSTAPDPCVDATEPAARPDRRSAPRVSPRGIRAVLNVGEALHSTQVVDLSTTGLRLRNGTLPMQILSKSPVRLLLMGDQDEPVSLSVRAVWTRERDERSTEYGFAREPLGAPVPVALARWIARAGGAEAS